MIERKMTDVPAGEYNISRRHNKNLISSIEKYNERERLRRNNEYLAKIDTSIQQYMQGQIITKTMEELQNMANRA